MPVLGFGTAASPPPEPLLLKQTVLDAIRLGYRHFDTSPRYLTEESLGEALAEAVSLGLVGSRSELFVTSKLWCADAHGGLVVPAIQRSLKNLKLDYLDLYLIHWPVSSKPGKYKFPIEEDDFLPMDYTEVWSEMEECKRLGLAKCIGVSNFSCKKLQHILSIATIPPSVNQVEMSPVWQQRKLKELCKSKGIALTAYSVLGSRVAFWGTHKIIESDVLKEIAEAKGKTVAQVSMRWAYEEGVSMVVKSFTKERLEENLKIFDCVNTTGASRSNIIPSGYHYPASTHENRTRKSGLKADLGDCNRNATYQIVAGRSLESDHWRDHGAITGVGKSKLRRASPARASSSVDYSVVEAPCSTSSLQEPKSQASVHHPLKPILHRLTTIGENRSRHEESSGRVTRRHHDDRTIDLKMEKTGSDGTVGPKSQLPSPPFFLGPRRFSIRSRDRFHRLK
ncbi:hypothetical protein Bca101_059708 [Brassica carinata]